AVILSARCTDKRVNIITKDLFKKYPTVFDLAKANVEELEKMIYSCGFYKNKAKNLIGMAKDVVEKFNGVVPSEFENLTTLSGVGRKTANVVMSVGFSKEAIAVDTHVFRVSNRLGLVSAKTPLECELGLQKVVEKNKWGQFHHFLVLFGRYNCKSQNPLCENCELSKFCNYKKLKN
ncbi:MAG: endonuclease III, partial [Clostridia bacterium]|nr:endonuclease III [Clostridia bacterium]